MKNPISAFADMMVEYYAARAAELLLRYGRRGAERSVRYNNYRNAEEMWKRHGATV